MAFTALLTNRSVIEVTGPDARPFLQGLVCNDMEACQRDHALYAALLTAQGKILFDFLIIEAGEDRFLIDCFLPSAAELTKRLLLYRLRAKIHIGLVSEFGVAAIWNTETPIQDLPETIPFADPRLTALGRRIIGPRARLEDAISRYPSGDYTLHRLDLAVPDSADLPPDTIFPLDAGLEDLSGVSFKKGCYVGQEVTARMKHRATARRRFLLGETEDAWPAPGTTVLAGERELGSLATGKGRRGLAFIRLDRWEEAMQSGNVVTAGGKPIRLKKSFWSGI